MSERPRLHPFLQVGTVLAVIALVIAIVKEGKQGQTGDMGPPSVPIGGIVAWHRNPGAGMVNGEFNPGPTMQWDDAGLGQDAKVVWLECDGRDVPEDSPLFRLGMKQTPTLNSSGRFLRGGKDSGIFQLSQVGKHRHPMPGIPVGSDAQAGTGVSYRNPNRDTSKDHLGEFNSLVEGAPDETRPTNMSIIWIIRVQ